ncbi:5'-nucleotidase C-terminal domain-containing protein, partial [Klebsiella pneumoniae]|uniref:5'-nucleotidase C-terminal domain-containing protein n=1 Tax=Klebsiella pneumoniae TaxID=573 RepID=UPI0038525167
VGKITGDMLRARTSSGAEDRGSYSTLGNTVADVYLWATSANPSYGGTPTQIAFMNPGGLRADLPFGTDGGSVSYREAANVQPFGNTLVTL